jgi:hypothetical protein
MAIYFNNFPILSTLYRWRRGRESEGIGNGCFYKIIPIIDYRTCLRGRESEKVQILIINYSKLK